MHLNGIDYTWLHWKRRSCIFDPNFDSWTFSFDKSHLDWIRSNIWFFMQRFWCVFPFPVFYFLFFPVLGFVFDIPHIFCYRASTIVQVWKFQENGATLQTLKKKLIFNGWNVDHKNPGPNCLPVSMVDLEGLQAWDVWVSWRLDRVPGSMMLWWIPWMSHLPKLKSDGGKLTYAGFILYKENLLSLGENRRLKKSKFTYGHIHISKKT